MGGRVDDGLSFPTCLKAGRLDWEPEFIYLRKHDFRNTECNRHHEEPNEVRRRNDLIDGQRLDPYAPRLWLGAQDDGGLALNHVSG